jgi:hypothetical protein
VGEWRYSYTHSLTPALNGCEWSASRPGRFTPRKRAPDTHWIRGWVSPRAVLDAVVKRKIPSPRRESNPRTTIVQPVAQRYTDWAITALNEIEVMKWKEKERKVIWGFCLRRRNGRKVTTLSEEKPKAFLCLLRTICRQCTSFHRDLLHYYNWFSVAK